MQHESLQRSVTTAAVVIKPVPPGWRPWEQQTAPGLSLGLNSPRPASFTNVHADRVCAVRGRWWTSVNAGAHCSATLTCENTDRRRQLAGASSCPGLSYWSQFPASGGYRRWDSPRCCAWSRASWTGLNGGAHAAEACASELGHYAERQVSQEPTVAPKACQVLTAAELAAVAPE